MPIGYLAPLLLLGVAVLALRCLRAGSAAAAVAREQGAGLVGTFTRTTDSPPTSIKGSAP